MQEVKMPTISIKGKDYVLVKDRVLYFNEKYPNGAIKTERLSEGDMEIFKATVYPDCNDMDRCFTGYSQAKWGDGFINTNACLENAESSAVGRALAFMGIGVIESIASADEMIKAGATKDEKKEDRKSEESKSTTDELPWFNKPELERLKANRNYLDRFENTQSLIDDLKKHYRVSNEMKQNIADVRALDSNESK